MDAITIELAPVPTEEVRGLVEELEDVLAAEYPPEQRHGLALDAIFKPHIKFFVARTAGVAIGCAGVAFFGDFAELKRMYVRPGARGGGVSKALLARIEQETKQAGIDALMLETGPRQLAALRFYEREGFRPRGAFGHYIGMKPEAVAASVFLAKSLAASP